MADYATIARPYAEALFDLTRGETQATETWLESLSQVAANSEFLQFAADPRLAGAQVFQVVTSILKQPLPERGANFLRAVIENERLAALPEIARQYRILANNAAGYADAVISSAFPIAPKDLDSLLQSLEKRFGRKLHPVVEIDESLIGGIRVSVGDEVLDTSVKARLERMKAALIA